MKKKPSPAAISAYAFREEDPQPFGGNNLFREFFRNAFCHHRDTLLSDKKQKCGKNTSSAKKLKKRSKRSVLKKNAAPRKIRENWPSSGSNDMEARDSDAQSDQDTRKNLEMRGSGSFARLGNPKCQDFETEEKQEVVFDGGPLLLLPQNITVFSYRFIFTANTVNLKIQNEGLEHNVTWPVHEIQSFRSFAKEERGLAFIKLDLTEHGQLVLLKALKGLIEIDNYCMVTSLCSPTTEISSFEKEIKRITSLSDQYKSMWRPGEKDVMEQVRKVWEHVCSQRKCWGILEHESLLGDDMVQDSDRVGLNDWIDLVYPTKEDNDAIIVTKYDYMLLDPNEFVSDTIIDFYIKYIQSLLGEEHKKRFYFYNSFFFRKLTEIDKNSLHGFEHRKSSFERVKRWTARMDIFEKDYLFIPVMHCAHWSLVIICHPGCLSADYCDMKAPIILHFDSLEGSHASIEGPIRNYLVEAWNERQGYSEDLKRLSAIKFITTKVPQQTNYSDCGLFLLHYVELFVQAVLEKDTLDFVTDGWFIPADASRKREVIRSLIQRLKVEELAGRHDCLQQHKFASKPSDCLEGELSDQALSPHFHSQHTVQGGAATSLELTRPALTSEHQGSGVGGQFSYPVEGQIPCAGIDIGSCSHQRRAAENKLPNSPCVEDCMVCLDNPAPTNDDLWDYGTPDSQNLRWKNYNGSWSSPLAFNRGSEMHGTGRHATSAEEQGDEIVEIEGNECRCSSSRAGTLGALDEQWEEQDTIACAVGIDHSDSQLCQGKESSMTGQAKESSAKGRSANDLLELVTTEETATSRTLVTMRTCPFRLTGSSSPRKERNRGLMEVLCISSDEEQT